MRLARVAYRARQFWRALRATPDPENLRQAEKFLSSQQLVLFACLAPAEQAHAYEVLQTLMDRGEDHPDLMTAALLHDVGKIRHPLRLCERVLIVLVNALFPGKVKRLGCGKPQGWSRPFVIAQQHPAWGAEMAAENGASTLTVNLIGRHHEPLATLPASPEDHLLRALQAADEDH